MAKQATYRSPGTNEVQAVLAELEQLGSAKVRAGMGPRFGIVVDQAYGTTMAQLQQLAKTIGRNQELSLALWGTGVYDARMLACLIGEPAKVSAAQMDTWCADLDNWATCDTACFALFDRTPHAFAKVRQWAERGPEFERRAAFALLASLALHDKHSEDTPFLACLPLIRTAASDGRNFVKKGVSWALRAIGGRSVALREAAIELADALAASDDPTERWVGRDALRDIQRPLIARRAEKRDARKTKKK